MSDFREQIEAQSPTYVRFLKRRRRIQFLIDQAFFWGFLMLAVLAFGAGWQLGKYLL